MAWKMIGEPKVRRCTQALANEFASMTTLPHDRDFKSSLSAMLNVQFQKGRFRTCEWAKAYCHETKQTYRVNGKHTSTILSQMNGEFPKKLSVIVEEYECDTLQDVVDLYCTFDRGITSKKPADIYKTYAYIVPELHDIRGPIVGACAGGIAYAIWGDTYATHHSADDRGQLVAANPEFVVWAEGVITGTAAHLRRVPVVAAMFLTWKKSAKAATEFWTAVRDESGAKPVDADRKLAKFLSQSRLKTRHAVKVESCGNRETFVKCIHGWNAWRAGEVTSLAYFAAAKIPTVK